MKQLSIRQRIQLGFALILVALTAVTGISYLGASQTQERIELIHETNTRSRSVLELNYRISELHRDIQTYTYTGHESSIRRVHEGFDRILRALDQQKLAAESDQRELVARMHAHLATSKETFKFAVEERQLRDALVLDVQQHQRNVTSALLNEPPASREQIETALTSVNENLYRYLSDPDYQRIVDAKARLSATIARAKLPENSVVRASLVDYGRALEMITRATRGYMYLTSVVIAGESQEFSYVSEQLRESIVEQTTRLSSALEMSSRQAQHYGFVLTAAILVVGFVLSTSLARSISEPLSQMTKTFRRLASGESIEAVPGTTRTDEIGVMARAANVFHEKNVQTEKLLQQSAELAQELDIHKVELERSNGEMEQFVYTVSHDLRSPLVTSMGFIGLIKELLDEGQFELAASKLPKLERANERMHLLINDLLDLSRVGRTDMDMSELSSQDLANDAVESNETQILDTRAIVQVAKDMPSVYVNRSRILQVLENLVGNALKYGRLDGSPARIEIGATQNESAVSIYVRDHGPGIPPEHHKRIFELFQRLDNSLPGTGVGLAVVQKTMEFHNGSVEIESNGQNDGTCFWLHFPPPSRITEQEAA